MRPCGRCFLETACNPSTPCTKPHRERISPTVRPLLRHLTARATCKRVCLEHALLMCGSPGSTSPLRSRRSLRGRLQSPECLPVSDRDGPRLDRAHNPEPRPAQRSEEHTSEIQSHVKLVC